MQDIYIRLKLFFIAYKQESFLLVISLLTSVMGIVMLVGAFHVSSRQSEAKPVVEVTPHPISPVPTAKPTPKMITVDVSGAVKRPHTYRLADGARLVDAIEMAGGLSSIADNDYFYRNYNNARILIDQEKIYIPRRDEVGKGVFVEEAYYVEDATLPSPTALLTPTASVSLGQNATLLDINTASQAQLEDLPGVGPITAEKIIRNRPYTSFDDLATKSGLTVGVISKFQDQITYE